jgi:hypothetical protein
MAPTLAIGLDKSVGYDRVRGVMVPSKYGSGDDHGAGDLLKHLREVVEKELGVVRGDDGP